MEFSGTFELEDATVEEVWLAMSDPVLIREALPGCTFLVEVEDEDVDFDELREAAAAADRGEPTADPAVIEKRAFQEGETYAALLEISLGSVNPTFEAVGRIDEREKPRMAASGEGRSGDSSFEASSSMELRETDGGVEVDWEAQAEVFGRIAQMGQRMVNPAANRVAKRFFQSMQERIRDLGVEEDADAAGASASGGDEAAHTAGGEADDPKAGAEGEAGAADATEGGEADAADAGVGEEDGILARLKRLLRIG